jgi:hypothetical protein
LPAETDGEVEAVGIDATAIELRQACGNAVG